MADTLLVRLKAYAPRQGFVLQRFLVYGMRFEAGRGWYEVPRHVGDYLRNVHETQDDPRSPFAFDVCTREEAQMLEDQERQREAAAVAAASAPRVAPLVQTVNSGDLTTADLPRSTAPVPEAAPASNPQPAPVAAPPKAIRRRNAAPAKPFP